MLLSFDQEGIQSESTQNYLEAGLGVKAILKSVGYALDRDKKVTKNLQFAFEGTDPSNKGAFNFTVFVSNFDKKDQYNVDLTEEKFQAKVNREMSRIFHILTAYAEEDQVKGLLAAANNKIEKAFELVIEAMNSIDFVTVPLDLKVVYDMKGISNVP